MTTNKTPTDEQQHAMPDDAAHLPEDAYLNQVSTSMLKPSTGQTVTKLYPHEVAPSEFVPSCSYDIFNSKALNVLGTLPNGMDSCEIELFVYSQSYICGTREDGAYNCLRDILYPSAYLSPNVLQWILIANERHKWFIRGSKICPSSIYRRRARVFRMTTDLLSNSATSISDETVVAVTTAVAMDFEDGYTRQKVVAAHVNGLDLLLRSRGGLSTFHGTPWVVGHLVWALTASGGGVFRTKREWQTSRAEIGMMLRSMNAWNQHLIKRAAMTDNGDWLTYFSAQRELLGPHSPFRPLMAPDSPSSARITLAPNMPADQHCRLIISTILSLALWDHRDDPVTATNYLSSLKTALSTSAFVDNVTGQWLISIQMVCALITFGGFEMHGRQGDGYKRECERTEKAVGILHFAAAMGNETVDKLIKLMLGWLFLEESAGFLFNSSVPFGHA